MNKKANILTENIIFIILNLLFIAILLTFLFTKGGGGAVLEEKYAKEIALIIDSAKQGMTIQLGMEDAFEVTNKNKYEKEPVIVNGNVVRVKLDEDSKGYSYSFFNDIGFEYYFDGDKLIMVF